MTWSSIIKIKVMKEYSVKDKENKKDISMNYQIKYYKENDCYFIDYISRKCRSEETDKSKNKKNND